MKRYKKRTVALILASMVTVVGAFGAENYKNSLMSLKFESAANGAINLTIFTKNSYSGNLNLIKKDTTTYIMMLPEINSQMPTSPTLGNHIDSVDIRTMPYTKNNKGYTKITIKTAPNITINAKNAIYIPEKKSEDIPKIQEIDNTTIIKEKNSETINTSDANNNIKLPSNIQNNINKSDVANIEDSIKQFEKPNDNIVKNSKITEDKLTQEENILESSQEITPQKNETDSSEFLLIILGTLLIIISSIYFYIKGKNKIAEIIGEQTDFEIDDDSAKKNTKQEKNNNVKKIKKTIHKLDKKYSVYPIRKTAAAEEEDNNVKIKPVEVVSDSSIVDLDEIYKETNEKKESEDSSDIESNEENSALEDFLSAYTFSEENEEQEADEQVSLFNEELFDKFINDDSLVFSQEDIAKIEKLLNSEISDDTLKNLDSFVVTNPIEKRPSRTEILENFVTTYAINQNIVFSNDDIKALNKLISVEIDNDFITDLRTNPERMKEMQVELEKNNEQPHKKSEILTLNVKDMLPNLSDALKKQGGKQIESEYKPQVVYFSEGYDVSTISLKDQLPDLSVEINNADAYISRPSDEVEYAESGYEVQKLEVSEEISNLDDMLKHPEKYENKKEQPVEVDEDALLQSIANVHFKPFYDGSENFEVLNHFDDNAPSVSDIQEEFNQIGEGFEIINDDSDQEIVADSSNDNDDFESLFDNKYVDFDKPINDKDVNFESLNVENNTKTSSHPKTDAENLIDLIEKKQAQKEQKIKTKQKEFKNTTSASIEEIQKQTEEKKESEISNTCIIDNDIYEIVSSVDLGDNKGCYLARSSLGYFVIGFIKQQLFKIKFYEKLNSENLQARISKKFYDGIARYIIRIGVHKFIMNVSDEKMEYVMDLC